MIGSQLIMDLPAGGEDYDLDQNVTGCGIPAEGRTLTTNRSSRVQQWPWLVALYHPKELETGNEQQFCGGALITDIHILTAAHCLQGVSPQDIRVRLGEYDFSKFNETRSQDIPVADFVNHENFVLSTYENDIAIVRLAQPTSFNSYIWPICLPPTGESFENETVVVAGWGQTQYAGTTSEILLQVAVPVWNQDKCADSFVQRITEYNLCAAGYDGGQDSCQVNVNTAVQLSRIELNAITCSTEYRWKEIGNDLDTQMFSGSYMKIADGDSGGPLMYQLENGRWVTVGVVSWGIECGNKGSPGIYARVNRFIPWIIKHTIAKA